MNLTKKTINDSLVFISLIILTVWIVILSGCSGKTRGTGLGQSVAGRVTIVNTNEPIINSGIIIESINLSGEIIDTAATDTDNNGNYAVEIKSQDSSSIRLTVNIDDSQLVSEVSTPREFTVAEINLSVSPNRDKIDEIDSSFRNSDQLPNPTIEDTSNPEESIEPSATISFSDETLATPLATTTPLSKPTNIVPIGNIPLPVPTRTNIPPTRTPVITPIINTTPTPVPTKLNNSTPAPPTPSITLTTSPIPTAIPTGVSENTPKIPISGPTSGLIAYWSFDDVNGSSVNDSSGISGPGELKLGAKIVDGKVGNSGWFNCKDSRMDIPLNGLSRNGLTVSAWINIDQPVPNFKRGKDSSRIFSRAFGTSNEESDFTIHLENDGLIKTRFRINNRTPGHMSSKDFTVKQGIWAHVAIAWDGVKGFVYVNGQRKSQFRIVGNFDFREGIKSAIGNQPDGAGNRPFCGRIDEVRVYSRQLSEAEVRTLAN